MRDDTANQTNPSLNPSEKWELILFVAGNDMANQRILKRLEVICEEHLRGRYHITLVNIFEDPGQAYTFDIIATPTVVRRHPKPLRKLMGDLSFTEKVLIGLELPPCESRC